jgi:hypothetical protein
MTSRGTKTLKPQAALNPIPTVIPSKVSDITLSRFSPILASNLFSLLVIEIGGDQQSKHHSGKGQRI